MPKLTILFIAFFALSCRSTAPRLIFDQSYFYAHQRYIEITESPTHLKNDSTGVIKGIYLPAKKKNESPQLNIFREKAGFLRVPLARPISASKNALVEISGKWKIALHAIPYIKKKIRSLELFPLEFDELALCENFIPMLDSIYRKNLSEIERRITPAGSKLKLAQRPKWEFFYDDGRAKIIALTHQFDLMYSASIEFIINPRTEKVETVQAKEWFKGEIE